MGSMKDEKRLLRKMKRYPPEDWETIPAVQMREEWEDERPHHDLIKTGRRLRHDGLTGWTWLPERSSSEKGINSDKLELRVGNDGGNGLDQEPSPRGDARHLYTAQVNLCFTKQ